MNRLYLFFIFVIAALQGCAAIDPALLVPDTPIAAIDADSALRGSIAVVEIDEKKDLDDMGFSRVSNRELAEALRLSLNRVGLLADSEQAARYRLTALLADVALGSVGYDATGRVLVRYRLSDAAGKIVLDELVRSTHTVAFTDELIGYFRGKRTVEGVFRANIAEFLRLLVRFRPPDTPAHRGRGGAVK